MNIIIDTKSCSCEKGEYLWDIAARNGIDIPTLCRHEGLSGQGCCRVCIVEVIERGWSKIVVSCVYPVSGECEVFTNSEKVKRQRGMTLRLLQKRAPQSEVIASMCEAYGAPNPDRLNDAREGKCILCSLCVNACNALGAGAISSVNRGVTKEISTPYKEPAADCIGCGSCARVCPTGAIDIRENESIRTVWGRDFELIRCKDCSQILGTAEELSFAAKKAGKEEADSLCQTCRKKRISDTMAHTYGIMSAKRPLY